MAKKKMEPLVVTSKTKAILKKQGCNTASDAMDGLNGWVLLVAGASGKTRKSQWPQNCARL